MQNYLLLVLSLYAILMTSIVLAFRLGSSHRNRNTFVLATVAVVVCAISWESVFATGSLFGFGPYALTSHTYGYTTLAQPIGLFCIRTGLTVVLALPAALLTLTFFRSNHSPTATHVG
jgi:hypothetical protein